jgi:hypothetical protein
MFALFPDCWPHFRPAFWLANPMFALFPNCWPNFLSAFWLANPRICLLPDWPTPCRHSVFLELISPRAGTTSCMYCNYEYNIYIHISFAPELIIIIETIHKLCTSDQWTVILYFAFLLNITKIICRSSNLVPRDSFQPIKKGYRSSNWMMVILFLYFVFSTDLRSLSLQESLLLTLW